jgi:DNA anti-recombination protein RmuC
MADDVHKEIADLKAKLKKIADALDRLGSTVSDELGTLNKRLNDIVRRVRKIEQKVGIEE